MDMKERKGNSIAGKRTNGMENEPSYSGNAGYVLELPL